MSVTDTDAPAAAATMTAAPATPAPVTGLATVLGSGDHKTIGRLWIATSLAFGGAAAVLGALVRFELIDTADLQLFSDGNDLAQAFSLHQVAWPFLVVLPLLLGLATAIVPLQIGARAIAFPRATAAAFWTHLLAGSLLVASFIMDGGPFGSDADGVALFVAAFLAVVISLIVAAISVATTAYALRADGMGLHRTPLFAWAGILVAGVGSLLYGVLGALLVIAYVDVRYGPTFLGFSDQLLGRLSWAWSTPSVLLLAVPALAIAADIVPVAARTRITQHRIVMGTIGALAVLSFGSWTMLNSTPSGTTEAFYFDTIPHVGFSVLAVLPILATMGLLADTLRRGAPRPISPLLWALGGGLMVLLGAVAGALISIEPLDLFGTAAPDGAGSLVLVGALVAALGGVVFWSPKLFGTQIPEALSSLLALGGIGAAALIGLPQVVAGFIDADETSTLETLDLASMLGSALLAAVLLGLLGLIAKSAFGDDDAEDDPWEGHTLEWATSSPPPAHNFDELPPVRSEAPVYDARHGEADS